MNQRLYFLFSLSVLTLFNCINEVETKHSKLDEHIPNSVVTQCSNYLKDEKQNNLNINILLDLSDRIEEYRIQEKDSAYLSLLAKAFTDHIKQKKLLLLHDRIQVYFNPTPADPRINKIADELTIQFSKDSPKELIETTLELYSKLPSQLYTFAKEDATKMGNYPGSDIWRFFKNNAGDYCISDCHRNLLIILTDGYMYHKNTMMQEQNKTSYLTPKSLDKLGLNSNQWQQKMIEKKLGFIPANSNLEDLEVLVIGIQSQNDKNPYTQDIINQYWANWLSEMGVKTFKIKHADIPTSMEKVISKFIHKY